MKNSLILFLLFCLSSCASLSEEGSKVKIVSTMAKAKYIIKNCKELAEVNGDRGLKPGFGKISEQLVQLKNNAAAINGNVVYISDISRKLISETYSGVIKGTAFKCPRKAHKLLGDES